ncbi:hypothetical protein J6590_007336 [Homalodisca vitripennis]|nr:hypothetical protein J6590_007336 [Homalodisca vitripennis]
MWVWGVGGVVLILGCDHIALSRENERTRALCDGYNIACSSRSRRQLERLNSKVVSASGGVLVNRTLICSTYRNKEGSQRNNVTWSWVLFTICLVHRLRPNAITHLTPELWSQRLSEEIKKVCDEEASVDSRFQESSL